MGQIMDVTDPAAPIPVSAVFDDTDGFHHFCPSLIDT